MMNSLVDNDPPGEPNEDCGAVATPVFDDSDKQAEEPFILSEVEPQSLGENIRQSGLAYSAGIVLFASVAFMLVIGWGADLLFGSSPWGIVVGLTLGALVGFFQFFRLTSQIFKK
ncbi:MAG: AtpZ/AtpI family protein [bacterium]|nr:AtpZ/AtpI family protein [bacterium]